ncbi:MAG: tRNA (guanosine(37)-N1)-methyltransferase TrmD [Gammaproteobacteria bacterium]|nr:tRNA (guanosine(37)-N1)-methyltransferase TrmD [Gammaproteobacteria bacterium]NNJ51279.1 tRNA (guanosine(37)-N1)-methyltransferase TrmD [Gammaproteobacteria bacterium]
MNIYLISLFPELVHQAAAFGVLGRAIKQQQLNLQCINPRDYAQDKHRTVDDRPYGGGPGMLMKVEPLAKAIMAAKSEASDNAKVVYMSPQGQQVNQQLFVSTAAERRDLILIAGRYEGIDERLIESLVDAEWSIGDYVLSGGEFAALVVVDAITRLIPGVLGDDESAMQDSFMDGLLDCPHYTRPESIDDEAVPEVLLSGDHEAIRRWRLKQALGRTWLRRPDLLDVMQNDASRWDEEKADLLAEFKKEHL